MAESEGISRSKGAPGRRRMNASEPRRNRVVVTCTDDEYRMLFGMAAAQGISLQNVMMRAVMSGGTQSAQKTAELVDELRSTRQLLAVATGLLNQLAKVANSTGEVPPEIPDALRMMQRGSRKVDGFLSEFSDRFSYDGRGGRA